MELKCCVCKRVMRKWHYIGKEVCFATYISDNLDLRKITFPQPFCKKCSKAFQEWLRERNVFMQK